MDNAGGRGQPCLTGGSASYDLRRVLPHAVAEQQGCYGILPGS